MAGLRAICGKLPKLGQAGTTGGGVWKTTDAGHSWQNVSDGFFETASIGAIEVADSDANVIYVGTGSAASSDSNRNSNASSTGAKPPADVRQHGRDFSPLLRGETPGDWRTHVFAQYDLHNAGLAFLGYYEDIPRDKIALQMRVMLSAPMDGSTR